MIALPAASSLPFFICAFISLSPFLIPLLSTLHSTVIQVASAFGSPIGVGIDLDLRVMTSNIARRGQ